MAGFLSNLGGFAKSASQAASMIPAVYRARPVKLSLKYPTITINESGQPLVGAKTLECELSEVTAVRQSTVADVAVFAGNTQAVMQPWYFKPFEITIEGKSNMGIFEPGIFSVNVGNDADIEKVLQMRDATQSVFQSPEAADKNVFYATLEYGAPDNDLLRTVQQQFRGYIAGIDISEDDSTPYIKTYSIRFIGEFLTAFNIKKGASGQKKDKKAQAIDKIDEMGPEAYGEMLKKRDAETQRLAGKYNKTALGLEPTDFDPSRKKYTQDFPSPFGTDVG